MNIIQKVWKSLSTRESLVDLSGANSLFGSIGKRRIPVPITQDFIPLDDQGNVIDLQEDSVDAKWLGLEYKSMQWWAYNYCSPLAAVIDRLAEADTNGRVEFLNDDGTTVKNPNKIPSLQRVKNLMLNPNPIQTWEEFNSEQVVLCKIFGYCPVLAIRPYGLDSTYTKYMFNLNPYILNPIPNPNYSMYGNKPDDGVDRINPILQWQFTYFGVNYNISADDIILVKDGYQNSILMNVPLPISKIAGLDFFVSNICAAMEADNVLLKKKGPLGVFSHDPKPDMAGWQPLTNEQKDDIQRDLKRYGLTIGQLQYVVSKTPLKWNAMSFNLRDLMTKETVRQGIDGICDRFGYPAELMSGKNATYENRNSAEKFLYQNNIIPFSLRRMARYNRFFNLGSYEIVLDYDHLPVLQEDILHAGNAAYAESQGLLIEWQAGMITWNQWQILKDRDTVPGMDIFYPEWMKKFGKDLNQNNAKDTPPKNTGTTK